MASASKARQVPGTTEPWGTHNEREERPDPQVLSDTRDVPRCAAVQTLGAACAPARGLLIEVAMGLAKLSLGAWVAFFVLASVACGSDDSTSGSAPAEGGAPGQDGGPPIADGGRDASAPSGDGAPGDEAADGAPANDAANAPHDGAPSGDAMEAAAGDAEASTDGSTLSCTTPPADVAACATTNDCGIVSAGCYCGQQLEYGVASKYLSAKAACESAAARSCGRGCANFPGHVAQDGRSDLDGGTIAVHCVSVDGGALECRTFLP